MAELTIQVQDCKDVPHGVVVALAGAIDAKSVLHFQNQLNAVKDRGICRFILDMEDVKYVNSTGLGYLINLADSVQPQGGGVALVKVQPKVKVVFDMLGLNAFFHIFDTRKEAVQHFPVGAAATAPAAVPTAQAAPRVRASEAAAGSGAESTIECEACHSVLAVTGAGAYQCPRCAAGFTWQPGGRAVFASRGNMLQLQLSLAATPECREGVGYFVGVLARRAGFTHDLAECIREAVTDTVDELVANACGGDPSSVYHLLLMSTDSRIEVRLSDSGKTLSPGATGARGQELFSLGRQVMDTFELRPHPRGGNVIAMSKKAGT